MKDHPSMRSLTEATITVLLIAAVAVAFGSLLYQVAIAR